MYLNLYNLRKTQGITQAQMAQMVGCSLMSYNRKERDKEKANFKIDEMMIIQKHFNKPLDYIFFKEQV